MGLDNSACGQLPSPCKNLNVAVDRTANHGTIKIIGNYYLKLSIQLYKSMKFEGVGDSSILALNNKVSIFLFEIPSVSLNFTFVSLRLEGIGLFYARGESTHSMNVVVLNCSFEGRQNGALLDSVSEKGPISFYINNSTFTNMKSIFNVWNPTPVLTIKHCSFVNITKRSQFHKKDFLNLKKLFILNSTFLNVELFSVKLRGKTQPSVISGCHFSNVNLDIYHWDTSDIGVIMNITYNVFVSSHVWLGAKIEDNRKEYTLSLSHCVFTSDRNTEYLLRVEPRYSNGILKAVYMIDIECKNSLTTKGCLIISEVKNVLIRSSVFKSNIGSGLLV